MKVAALITGGKDSIYAAMRVVREGHTLVCLANVCPPPGGAEEADSMMFQTVGFWALPMVAEAMGLPLVRSHLTRGSVSTGMDYESDPDDEIEDLWELLKEVRERFPDVEAVCSGAVGSTYQKRRVEHLCARAGLTALSPIWGRNQVSLLSELREEGVDAVIIKIASEMMVTEHLGRRISELAPFLCSMEGFNAAGEGGEFESFVLDCPAYSFPLVMEDTEVVKDGRAAYIRFKVKAGKRESNQ